MTDCFHCGQDDHLSYDCTNRTRRRTTPPAAWPTATAETTGTPQPPPFSSLYQRPIEERADATPWADSIREAMGWPKIGSDERLRGLARDQVTEARTTRNYRL